MNLTLIAVDLGHQLYPEHVHASYFAFYSYLEDAFVEMDGEQVWSSWASFLDAYEREVRGIRHRAHNHLKEFEEALRHHTRGPSIANVTAGVRPQSQF